MPALACGTPARELGAAAPAAGVVAHLWSTEPIRSDGQAPVGVARTRMERVADRSRPGEAGNCDRVASPRVSAWWTWKRRRPGRRPIAPEIRGLIRTMAEANPSWGA